MNYKKYPFRTGDDKAKLALILGVIAGAILALLSLGIGLVMLFAFPPLALAFLPLALLCGGVIFLSYRQYKKTLRIKDEQRVTHPNYFIPNLVVEGFINDEKNPVRLPVSQARKGGYILLVLGVFALMLFAILIGMGNAAPYFNLILLGITFPAIGISQLVTTNNTEKYLTELRQSNPEQFVHTQPQSSPQPGQYPPPLLPPQ